MKVKIIKLYDKDKTGTFIKIPEVVIAQLGWQGVTTVDLDIPMTGGGLTIHKVGEERS